MIIESYDKAIEDFSESIRLNPSHFESLSMRGRAFEIIGNHEKAKADFHEHFEHVFRKDFNFVILSEKLKKEYGKGRGNK